LKSLQTLKTNEETSKELCSILNALGKTQTNVEVNNSFSYTKGLSAEDLIHEFKRLGSLARSTLDGGRIQSVDAGGSGEIPTSTE
jgi:hypothetical protein